MANALKQELIGKLVRVGSWPQPVRVINGSGAYTFTTGQALICRDERTGEQRRFEGWDVESIVDEPLTAPTATED